MPSIRSERHVPAAADAIWAAIASPRRFGEWLTIHDQWITEPPEALEKDSELHERVKLMGMINKVAWRVTEHVPPRTMTIAGTGLAGVKVAFTLSVAPEADGALVAIDASFEGQLIVGPLGEAVTKDAKANLDDSLGKLAALVEGGAR